MHLKTQWRDSTKSALHNGFFRSILNTMKQIFIKDWLQEFCDALRSLNCACLCAGGAIMAPVLRLPVQNSQVLGGREDVLFKIL